MVKGWMSIMDTRLGKSKIYFKAQDFGKMLKLKDVENLVITNVNIKDAKEIEVEIATPICNATNNRVSKLPFSANIQRQAFVEEDVDNNTAYHIGINFIKKKGIFIAIYRETRNIVTLENLYMEEESSNLYDMLSRYIRMYKCIKYDEKCNCKFYLDVMGFGKMLKDSLLANGVKFEDLVCFRGIKIKNKKIDDILKEIAYINPQIIKLFNEVLEYSEGLQLNVNLNGVISYKDDEIVDSNKMYFLEAILLPTLKLISF